MTDLAAMAEKLGFAWPDDQEGQWRVLTQMAEMALYWRGQVDEMSESCYADRQYQHLLRRAWALAVKLHNVRHAASRYRCRQNFDQAVRIVELESEIRKLRTRVAELDELAEGRVDAIIARLSRGAVDAAEE